MRLEETLVVWPPPPPRRSYWEPPSRRDLVRHGALLLTTLLTTTIAGAEWSGATVADGWAGLARGLPFSLTLLAILGCHESGHWLMCWRHGVSASLPWFIPAPPILTPLGTFGAFIRIRSRFPDRRALFDIGAAGPWAGFVVALVVFVVGLRLSHVAPDAPVDGIIELGDSLLTAGLTRLLLDADPQRVVLHPAAFAGWLGMLITFLNLLPAGQLDGGHVLYATLRRPVRIVAVVVGIALIWLGSHGWYGWLLWAAILAVMTRLGHPPTLDDQAPLGPARTAVAAATLLLFVIIFVPEPMRIIP